MILGYFDYIVIGVLIVLNIKFWSREFSGKGCLVGGLVFGIILPLISLTVEIQHVKTSIGIFDSSEILYTYLRFPTYWIIGTIQVLVSAVKLRYKESNKVA